ncbi:MAG: zinc ribbon domain-containing protein, partial [Candidatus Eremiobacterota bacterium]
MIGLMRCPRCQAEVDRDARFCDRCGRAQAAPGRGWLWLLVPIMLAGMLLAGWYAWDRFAPRTPGPTPT